MFENMLTVFSSFLPKLVSLHSVPKLIPCSLSQPGELMWLWERRRAHRQVMAGLFPTYQAISNLAAAQCLPYPVATTIGNVSLSNGQLARGAKLSVGHPPQSFAFLPQW